MSDAQREACSVQQEKRLARRRAVSAAFGVACRVLTWAGVAVLGVLLWHVARAGLPWLDLQFLTSFPSRKPDKAGILAALCGTGWLIALTMLLAVPLGVASAVYLEEYGRRGRWASFLSVNIANLAGVPSIVYGILGLTLFVRGLHLGTSLVAGAMTMTLLILPVVILASREAIRAVPGTIRQAAFALGATRWQVVRHHVVPASLPGLLTGVILSTSRAFGETAPLIMMGALTYVAFVPKHPMEAFTVLPIQVFNWASRPQKEFHGLAAAGILVLLAVLLAMNASAIVIRFRASRRFRW
ncbi:MAG: phosphate ABC transporter permease PstA [Planctomycetes bacterium]|nr:phosphate ABC transporter permease PstA [Planctomycetota bacterium]